MVQVHEGASDLKPGAESRIFTGNPQFDEIVTLYTGMTIMISDETFSEGRAFLHALFKHHPVLELVSPRQSWYSTAGKMPVDIENLQELSITVNKLRRSLQPQILIHSYLPELLVKHGSDQVLRLLDFWQAEVKQASHLEFYLIPKKTFVDFERKLMAVVDGAIELSVERMRNGLEHYFTPIRTAKDEYHLKPIKYVLEEGDIIIKQVGEIHRDLGGLRFIAQRITLDQEVVLSFSQETFPVDSAADYFLLKELDGWKFSWIKQVFPDDFERVLIKLAALVNDGVVKLDKTHEEVEPTINFIGLADRYVKRLKLLSSHEAVNILNTLAEHCMQRVSTFGDLKGLVGSLQELYGRLYGFSLQTEKVKRGWERTLEHALETVASLKAKVRRLGQNAYAVEISNCLLCRGQGARGSDCENLLANILKGLSTVLLGYGLVCSEVECSAAGGRKCIFQLRAVS
ncbi:MAG: hypothetical protein QXQ70_05275 [Candidatus Caldarchaeum sp.]